MKICKCGMKLHKKHNSNFYNPCPKCTFRAAVSSGKNRPDNQVISKPKANKFDFYKTTAWKWCRRYVLLYYSDKNGAVKCATSGRYMALNSRNCHCGHYIKVRDGNSTNYATALDFHNLAPQSSQDNTFMGGRQDLMREFLVKMHGEEKIKELEAKRRIPFKLDKYALDSAAKHYKSKYKELLKERGIADPWE